MSSVRQRFFHAFALIGALVLAAPLTVSAHVERPSYFPDPAADRSVQPAAGGKVPRVRALSTALDANRPGSTRVVCKGNSLALLQRSIDAARTDGYRLRPTDRLRRLSAEDARELMAFNRRLHNRCDYGEIQRAVTRSGNNDRVVVMPGVYTEPTARAKPTNDPSCDEYRTNGDRPGEEGTALSYAYQAHCPNDQNLIAVIGRTVGTGTDPVPPRENRHGIPNLGRCLRCNLQLEGSGVTADDVVIDAGDATRGNTGPSGAGAKKDVAVRADRADGFVLTNITTRHAGEHGVYVLETDGYALDRFKAFYNKLYGTLTFASDHGLTQDCETVGHGDSGVYPGGAPETGVQRPPGTEQRYNQEIRRCDLHHNLAGYSGTNGNAVHVRRNHIYDNSLGIQTDVVTGAGHPGYPGDSALFEENQIYSNNFNTYGPDSDVTPAFPFPIGTGLWIAGGNHHQVRENYFYDNWRRGTMIFSVPDSLACGPAAEGNQQAGCNPLAVSTSHYNRTYDNRMGVRPDGTADPNGVDFWWDQFPGARGNCWFRNSGPKPITGDPPPPLLPDCNDGKDPAMSIGTGNPENEAELIRCAVAFETRDFDEGSPCPWLTPPSEPQEGGGSPPAGLPALPARLDLPVARSSRTRARKDVPLGQTSCRDWNASDAAGRARLADRLRAFAGGVVNTGSKNVGTGAVLSTAETHALYAAWCGRAYAQDFLLYKLYTHAAAFARRVR